QAEDGIRVFHVTGVQTCALPISSCRTSLLVHWNVWMRFPIAPADHPVARANRVVHTMHAGAKHVPRAVSVSSGCGVTSIPHSAKIGRASCRARAQRGEGAGASKT